MENITERISLLDELGNGDTDRYYLGEELIQAYPALRQAALDGERYRKAGEEFMSAVQDIAERENTRLGNVWKAFMNSPYPPEFLTPMEALSEESRKKLQELYSAAEAYRQAVEQDYLR